jgi:S-ribosylhomocysteine lyase
MAPEMSIASFQVDHTKMKAGLFLSRRDAIGSAIFSTFDLRFMKPNTTFLTTTQAHTLEHLGATYFRNISPLKDSMVYFGPMGCRTGFYLILQGDLSPLDIRNEILNWLSWSMHQDRVPGDTAVECGNYKDLDANSIKDLCKNYMVWLVSTDTTRFEYPTSTEEEE